MPKKPTPSFLLQKFKPPQQQVKLSQRTRLLKLLSQAEAKSLITAVSPAGYGKSTLLSQYVEMLNQQGNAQVIWIAIDPSDNEPNKFFNIFSHALVHHNIADKQLINRSNSISANTDYDSFFIDIVGILHEVKHPIYLFIDDFHFLSDKVILHFFNQILQYAPQQLQLIISSRIQPRLEIANLLASGQMQMLQPEHFKLSIDEAFQLYSDQFSQSEITAFHDKTEGWVVAMQLIAIFHQQHPELALTSLLNQSIDILDLYMSEQIYHKLDANVQHFLLHTSLLDRFDPLIANYVCEIDNSTQLMSQIIPFSSLVIPIDSQQGFFRYHHLFADFLKQRLLQEVGEQTCRELRCKAAKYYANNDYFEEAVNQYIRANHIESAIALIASAGGWELILTRGIGYVESLLSQFNRTQITNSPTLGLIQCYLYLKLGEVNQASNSYELAYTLFKEYQQQDKPSSSRSRDFSIIKMLIDLYLDRGTDNRLINTLTELLETLEESDHLGRGVVLAGLGLIHNQLGRFEEAHSAALTSHQQMQLANCWVGINYNIFHQGQSLAYRGRLNEALELFKRASKMAKEHLGLDSGLQSMASCLKADIHYQVYQIEKAEELLASGIKVLESKDCWHDIYAVSFKLAINIAIARDDHNLCQHYLQRGYLVAQIRQLERLEKLLDVLSLKVTDKFCHLDKFNQLNSQIIRENYWETPQPMWFVISEYYYVIANHYLSRNMSNQALSYSQKLSLLALENNQKIDQVKALGIQCLSQFSTGNEKKAFRLVTQMLELASQVGCKQVFFELPNHIEALLLKLNLHSDENQLSSEGNRLLTWLISELKKSHQAQNNPWHLSSREQQICPLLSQGFTNKQISTTLGISENTVKFHLKNLFQKLGVINRQQAVLALATPK
ncbi:LuxR C-terminal-related transcriptional regulator [Shewanella woodyi]|uniref:ATP-dependent transcriptional regulator, MalT-like, LuxR family n=1 Tax=Shewanella woodyi (strain ATCC 51908 / MS32) TaxID=392500 RepID=B1KGF0_SHEWM|nr:LuxR C-terminal-related transcriptional regulator [Shewanella woodyi]ACA88287.1 ATP-dependent transcriptional regulator, MalT-like, LuxR family [Shewanella woodyi ATCC 51908]